MSLSKKYSILFSCCIIQFCYSSTYVWGIVQPLICEKYHVSISMSTLPYTLYMCVYALGGYISILLKKHLDTIHCIAVGNLMMCLGIIISALLPIHLYFLIFITFSVLSSIGCGISYCMVYQYAMAVFHDRKGFISSLMAFSLGISGYIITPIMEKCAALNGFTLAFSSIGILFLIMTSIAYPLLSTPEQTTILKDTYSANIQLHPNAPFYNKNTKEIFHSFYFVLFLLSFFFLLPSYLIINPIVVTLAKYHGLSPALSYWCVRIGSISSAIGSLLLPVLFDRIKPCFLFLINYLFLIVSAFLMLLTNGESFILAFPILPFFYAGIMASMPMYIANTFGMEQYSKIYSTCMIGLSTSSLLSPILQKYYTQPYLLFSFLLIFCVIGILATILFGINNNSICLKKQEREVPYV